MKVLVIGGGGREHALVWRLAQSPQKPMIYCAPGNAGIAEVANVVDIVATDIEKLVEFAKSEAIDLTVVGPEAPLCLGIVDAFTKKKLTIFGPNRAAAKLEGDKSFAKDLMSRHSIPTAAHRTFTDKDAALAFVQDTVDYPLVVKASGLAAGKGVIICKNAEEAEQAVQDVMFEKTLGDAGNCVVIEDFLDGEEVSVIAVTDGETIAVLDSSQDHKRLRDGDEGPNTGGMGAYSPAPVLTPELQAEVERSVLVPTVHAMNHERRPFRGVLYAGLMITKKGPKVLEYNVRFGDPECQVLMARYDGDLLELLHKTAIGKLGDVELKWSPKPAVCVVMAQKGYPGPVASGTVLDGVEAVDEMDDVTVFHAATRRSGADLVANGGRVLGVTAVGDNLRAAVDRAYEAVDGIVFPDARVRRDIAGRGLSRK